MPFVCCQCPGEENTVYLSWHHGLKPVVYFSKAGYLTPCVLLTWLPTSCANPRACACSVGYQNNVGGCSYWSSLCAFGHFITDFFVRTHFWHNCPVGGADRILTELNILEVGLEVTSADLHLVQTLIQSKSNFKTAWCFSRIWSAAFLKTS